MAVSDCTWAIIVIVASIYVGGALTSDITPTAVGAMSASGSSVCSDVDSRIFEGVPLAPMTVCPTEGSSTIAGGA